MLFRSDPKAAQKRAAWLAWREQVKQYRAHRHAAAAANKTQQQIENIKCAQSRSYFMTIYGTLHEPRRRKSNVGQPPFIPFAKQVELLDELDAALHAEEGDDQDVVVSKCRDVGATWVLATAAVHDWRSEERRVGKECRIGCRSRWSAYH